MRETKTNHEVSAALGFDVRQSTAERLVDARRMRVSVTGRLTASHAEAFAASLTSPERERLQAEEAVGLADLPDGHRAALVATLHTEGPAACLSALDTFAATGAETLAHEERARKAEAMRAAAGIVAETREAVKAAERAEAQRTDARSGRFRSTVDAFRGAGRFSEAQADGLVSTLREHGVTRAEAEMAEALATR